MRGNWKLLILAVSTLVVLISVCLGGQIYRWEAISWLSVLGYLYVRRVT